MDRIETERMMKKSFRISKRMTGSKKGDKIKKGSGEQIKALKKIIGVLLLVLAGIFGTVVARLPMWAAYVTVFAYICVQLWVWVDTPEK